MNTLPKEQVIEIQIRKVRRKMRDLDRMLTRWGYPIAYMEIRDGEFWIEFSGKCPDIDLERLTE